MVMRAVTITNEVFYFIEPDENTACRVVSSPVRNYKDLPRGFIFLKSVIYDRALIHSL